MSRLISRILLSLVSLFAAAIGYFTVYMLYESWRRSGNSYYPNEYGFLIAGFITWVSLAAYWVLLWRRAVEWTPLRKQLTALSFLIALGIGSASGLGLSIALRNGNADIALFVGSIVAPVAWVMTVIYFWRNAVGETQDSQAVVCPNCNYNLTGLTDARCPECGSTFTLDQLFAAQPSVVAAKQDREVT